MNYIKRFLCWAHSALFSKSESRFTCLSVGIIAVTISHTDYMTAFVVTILLAAVDVFAGGDAAKSDTK